MSTWLDGLIFGIKTVLGNGVPAVLRSKLNFVGGAVVTDDPVNKWTEVAITDVVSPFVFRLSGPYDSATIGGTIDPPRLVEGARTLATVSIFRDIAGGSGTTRIDILKNGTSVFAGTAQMPQVTFAAGANATQTVATFVAGAATLLDGDTLEAVLSAAETYTRTGDVEGPEGLTITARFS